MDDGIMLIPSASHNEAVSCRNVAQPLEVTDANGDGERDEILVAVGVSNNMDLCENKDGVEFRSSRGIVVDQDWFTLRDHYREQDVGRIGEMDALRGLWWLRPYGH